MGKSTKANRTKGNTRPSSSGHSAELLGLSGRPLSGFIGFDALEKDIPSYVPVTGQQASDAVDNTVDSDFRMVMRKMLKRDAVTRLKAMQEFGDYCIEKENDVLKNVLPFWPRLFNRLALDSDRRIREATHLSNGKLASKVKREMAPYLKNIMGVWLLGQCDLFAPSASSAQTTFSTTFPAAKQSEALMFCKAEIFSYFKDNLFEQTAKSMSEPNTTTPEDMENKYILVISATLRALKLFLTTVKPSEYPNIHDDFQSIVADGKFWKFAKFKEAQIRGAWYGLISSLCQLKPDVLSEMEKKLAITVFSNLSESDPMVAPAVWESALSIVINFENCWQGIDIHKVALPQLWSILKEGGKGNARVLFPCLLPFLSKLPKEIVESENFLSQFFSCFKQSLMLESVKLSSIECDAILIAFFECLQFICCTRLSNSIAGPKLLEKVIINEILPIVESSLYQNQCSHLAVSKLYPLLVSLIKTMESQCLHENENSPNSFTKVLAVLWENMLSIICKIFTVDQKQKNISVVYLLYFFNSLLSITSDIISKKQKQSVRFKEDTIKEELSDEDPSISIKSPDTVASFSLSKRDAQSFSHILNFCVLICEKLEEDCQQVYLRLLEEILASASSGDFIKELVKACRKSENASEVSSVGFFKADVLKWINKGGEDCSDSAFNIVFIICSFVSEEEAGIILDCCSKAHIAVLEQLLGKGLASYRCASFFQNWLKNSSWASKMVQDLQSLIEDNKLFSDASSENNIKVYHRILTMCLYDNDADLLVDDTSFENLVQTLKKLSEMLYTIHLHDENMDLALNFIREVTIAVFKNPEICWKFNATRELVHLFYHLNLHDIHVFKNPDIVSSVISEILNTSVDSYIKVNEEIMAEESLIYEIAKQINKSLCSIRKQKEALQVQQMCLSFLLSVQKSLATHKPELNSTLFVSYKLMDTVLPSNEVWNSLREGLAINILPLFLKHKLFYPLPQDEKFFYAKSDVLRLTFACDVISNVLNSDFMYSNDEENSKFYAHYIREVMPHLLWCLTFCKGTRACSEVSEDCFTERLEESIIKMLSFLPQSAIDLLKQDMLKESFQNKEWALGLQTLGKVYPSSNLKTIAEKHFENVFTVNESESLNMYVIRQVLCKHLSMSQKELHLEHLFKSIAEDLTDQNLIGRVSEICCYLQDRELQHFFDVQLLLETLHKAINHQSENQNDVNFMHQLLMVCIFSNEVDYGQYVVKQELWDFFINSLPILLKECKGKDFTTPSDVMVLYETVKLFYSMSIVLQAHDKDTDDKQKPTPLPKECYKDLILLFIQVSDVFNKFKPLPELCSMVLSCFLEAFNLISTDELAAILIEEDERSDGKSEDSILSGLILILTSGVRQLQFASHTVLLKMMSIVPLLPDDSKNQVDDDTEEKDERIPSTLSPLIELLKLLNEIVESMLLDIKISDLCTLVPHTDSYTYAMAYLLAWIEMLEFISSSPSQIRLGYTTHLEEINLLSSLFSNVFRFMPENPLLCLKKGLKVETPRKEDLRLLFIEPPKFSSGPASSEEIQSIACYVFATTLRRVPASIRTWWNNLDRKLADIVNNFTSKYISGILSVAEIQAVHENERQFKNLMVQARPALREVIATYTIDDCSIELCVQLPTNYPLGPISAERRGKVVIGQSEWRNWLMQLTTVLTYQNGSILDGLNIWKRNLDKKFEGVEECMICYYVLHSSTLKLPKLSCYVCRKKFHSACLYKWFRTSNNFTCPLCRNEFAM